MTYSTDFRQKVLEVKKENGWSKEITAKFFGISRSSLKRWEKRLEPMTYPKERKTKIDMEALEKDVKEQPEAYLHERAERLGVSNHGIFGALKRLNVTYKKKRYVTPKPAKQEEKISKN